MSTQIGAAKPKKLIPQELRASWFIRVIAILALIVFSSTLAYTGFSQEGPSLIGIIHVLISPFILVWSFGVLFRRAVINRDGVTQIGLIRKRSFGFQEVSSFDRFHGGMRIQFKDGSKLEIPAFMGDVDTATETLIEMTGQWPESWQEESESESESEEPPSLGKSE
jgi:hypothetical protein